MREKGGENYMDSLTATFVRQADTKNTAKFAPVAPAEGAPRLKVSGTIYVFPISGAANAPKGYNVTLTPIV